MNMGRSGVLRKPSTMGLTDLTWGMAWIWRTTRSSRLLRLMSATSRCMTVMLPAPPLPARPLSWPIMPSIMPPSMTSVATPMPMPVAEMRVRVRRRHRLRKLWLPMRESTPLDSLPPPPS